jgi:hypothetical protein
LRERGDEARGVFVRELSSDLLGAYLTASGLIKVNHFPENPWEIVFVTLKEW